MQPREAKPNAATTQIEQQTIEITLLRRILGKAKYNRLPKQTKIAEIRITWNEHISKSK